MSEEFDILIKNFKHYQEVATKHGRVLTKFLNETECELLDGIIKEPATYQLYGGYEDAEMKKALIHHVDDSAVEDEFEIVMLELKANPKFLVLTHKHIFGTMMSLGIKRNTFGDIVVSDQAYLFVDKTIADYVMNELTMIGGARVEVTAKDPKMYQSILKKEYAMEQIIIASMRLDAIVARVAHLSREKAQIIIKEQLVKCNHKISENPSQIVKINDIISIRKFGRVKVFGVIGQTKKDRIVLSIGTLR
ncbi:MAG TPA: YlmH/Sll1252 family protein [Bacilli bacterium]|nr:YlmH/Sll1252 family protein [Bacilli bacterium]